MTTYLQVNFKDGKLFEYSTNKKEGFEEHFNSKGEAKGYRKYYPTITGNILSLKEKENVKMNNRKELNITFKVDDNLYIVVFNVYNQNKNFDVYAESLIAQLPAIEKGEMYTLRCYNFLNKEGRTFIGCSLSVGGKDGEKVEKLRQRYKKKDGSVTEGVIPELIWTQKRGQWVIDNDDQQEYLYKVYSESLERLEGEVSFDSNAIKPKESSMTETQTGKEAPEKGGTFLEEEESDDDLPF